MNKKPDATYDLLAERVEQLESATKRFEEYIEISRQRDFGVIEKAARHRAEFDLLRRDFDLLVARQGKLVRTVKKALEPRQPLFGRIKTYFTK